MIRKETLEFPPSDKYIDNLSIKLGIDTQYVLNIFLKQSFIYIYTIFIHPFSTHRKNPTNFSRLAIFHSNEGVDRCFPRPSNQQRLDGTESKKGGKKKEEKRKKERNVTTTKREEWNTRRKKTSVGYRVSN